MVKVGEIQNDDVVWFSKIFDMDSFLVNAHFDNWTKNKSKVEIYDWINLSDLGKKFESRIKKCLLNETSIGLSTFPVRERNFKITFTNASELIEYLAANSDFTMISGFIFSQNIFLIFEIDLELLILVDIGSSGLYKGVFGNPYSHEKFLKHISDLKRKGFIN